jgi:hypothetical protein
MKISRRSIPCVLVAAAALGGVLAGAPATVFTEKQRAHWAFQPIVRPPLPAPASASCEGPLDAFIASRLQAEGIAPAPEADRRVLIRRATADLHGLPPEPEDVERFAADPRPDAYERLVDRLLASPRYGERWARHWLDLVRYAESDGFKSDNYRAGSWRYRDYVIDAFNADRPYDRFVAEQIAGDELFPEDGEAQVATGFLRHWPYEDNGRDLDRAWAAILADVTDVTGQALMGLTVGCARCHDHKFDAILQEDYYRLQSFFAAMVPFDELPVGGKSEIEAYQARLRAWEDTTRELRAERGKLEAPFFIKEQQDLGKKFPPFVQEIIDKPAAERSVYEAQLIILAGAQLQPDAKKMAGRMDGDVRGRWEEINKRIAEFDSLRPGGIPMARGVRDIGASAPPVRIPGQEAGADIEPGYLTVLGGARPRVEAPEARPGSTGRRAALARWLTSPEHPLVRRVMVNRLWQHLFGRGLVATPGDFGVQGSPPSHPELLDWLAAELSAQGWSLKTIVRQMLVSSAYRRASSPPANEAGTAAKDPENRLLWRGSLRRLEAEALRDGMLACSGELDLQMGGESVFPDLPEGLTGRYGWKASADAGVKLRRSVYLAVKRNMHLPLLKTFDVPDNHFLCAERVRTTTPTQALVLLNERWVIERARVFAARLIAERGLEPEALLRGAHERVFARLADASELDVARRFLSSQRAVLAARLERKEPVFVPAGAEKDPALGAALVDYCHVLWNANEFFYVD